MILTSPNIGPKVGFAEVQVDVDIVNSIHCFVYEVDML